MDLGHLPEVRHFLSTLEFCDAVIQVANPLVREHLLGLIYMGFLVPVLKPALVQVRNVTFFLQNHLFQYFYNFCKTYLHMISNQHWEGNLNVILEHELKEFEA